MTMRTAWECLSVCEYLRLINDLCQGDDAKDKEIRILCVKGEKAGKILAKEVSRLNKKFWQKPNLYEKQKDWKEKLKMRLQDDYKQEESNETNPSLKRKGT